jgi:hypothetical protein
LGSCSHSCSIRAHPPRKRHLRSRPTQPLPPPANPQAAGIRFDNIHLGLAANPPAPCTAPFYGTVTARAPDGALCLCHQSYDGKKAFWEQLGTGKACWPDKK